MARRAEGLKEVARRAEGVMGGGEGGIEGVCWLGCVKKERKKGREGGTGLFFRHGRNGSDLICSFCVLWGEMDDGYIQLLGFDFILLCFLFYFPSLAFLSFSFAPLRSHFAFLLYFSLEIRGFRGRRRGGVSS